MPPSRSTPHVLVVAWGFPPSRASGVYRALALCNALVEADARVTVVTSDEEYFQLVTGTDDSLVSHIDPRVHVIRVPYQSRRLDPVIDHWSDQQVTDRKAFNDAEIARETSYFPERLYGPWRPALEDAVHRLHRTDPVDLVVATGNPYTSYAGAAHLHASFGVPFVLDDRDGWLLNVYTGEAREDLHVESWLEALTAACWESWYVNPPIAQWHQRYFPHLAERIHVVENGWDRSLLDPDTTVRIADGPVKVGYIGTINAGFPLEMVLDSWRVARGHTVPLDAQLHLFGSLGYQRSLPHYERLLDEAAAVGVVVRGPWPKARVAEAYAELDVLLFAKEGGQMITSGKIYEYVATGKPIVIAADPTQDVRRVVATYPRAFIAADESPEAVASAFGQAVGASSRGSSTELDAAQVVGAQWERSSVLSPEVSRLLARLQRESQDA